MTDYLLIDLADGEEHDRYRGEDDGQALRWALADAFVRSNGEPVTDGHRESMGETLDVLEATFVRSVDLRGPHGRWRVKAVRS